MPQDRVINQRLRTGLEALGAAWLIILPLIRPIIWNGDPGDLPNLFYLMLLSIAIATGLLLRATARDVTPRPASWGIWIGGVFLAWAAVGCLRSPVPAQAVYLWIGWALHIAAPLALWPIIRRRPELLVAGLLAGLGLELMVMAGQFLWERPAMQRDFALDPNIIPSESMRDQYTVRVHSWRLEGSFLLANTLATYLIILWPIVADIAIQSWRNTIKKMSWIVISGLAISTLALAMTGSKAGMLAWLMSLVIAVIWYRPRWRWIAGFLLIVVIVSAIAVPAVRAKAAGSLTERIGYWDGALTLIREKPVTGWGLEGFSVHFPRVKNPAIEPSVMVHNEFLQAACDLGIIGAGIFLAWCVWLTMRLKKCSLSDGIRTVRPSESRSWPLVAGAACFITFGAMGVMSANFHSYPFDCGWAWIIIYALCAGIIVAKSVLLPIPSSAAVCIGVVACFLHALADFHLHSMQVVGILAWIAVLGLSRNEATEQMVPASSRRENSYAIAGLLAIIFSLGFMAWGLSHTEQKNRSHDVVESLRRLLLWRDSHNDALRAPATERLNRTLERNNWALVGMNDPQPHLAPQVLELAITTMNDSLALSRQWPAHSEQAYVASQIASLIHHLRPDSISCLTPTMRTLATDWPLQPFALQGIAWHLQRLADTDTQHRDALCREAQEWLHKAVALSPGYLPVREQLVEVSRQIGDQATVDSETTELHRLAPIVHETGRASKDW